MFKLDEDINGFNVDATYTHIEPSEILEDEYKSDYRMLRPKLSVVLTYKKRSVNKQYTLSAMDLIKNIKYKGGWGRPFKYTGNSIFRVVDGENDVIVQKDNTRQLIYASPSSTKGVQLSDLTFTYNPTQEDLKYILWALIMDMLYVYEYDTDEFAEMFMGDSCSIQKLRESEVVYNTIKNDIFNLSLNEDILIETMDKLRDMGIE